MRQVCGAVSLSNLKLGSKMFCGTQSLLQQHHSGLCYVGFSIEGDRKNEAIAEEQLEVNKLYSQRCKLQSG